MAVYKIQKIKEALECGQRYYYEDINNPEFFGEKDWANDDSDYHKLKCGVCHTTPSSAAVMCMLRHHIEPTIKL